MTMTLQFLSYFHTIYNTHELKTLSYQQTKKRQVERVFPTHIKIDP